MPRKYVFFLTGLFLFFLFVIFSYLVHKNLFLHLDFDTTVRLQDNVPRRVDNLFSFFSIIGNAEVMGILLLVLLALGRKIWFGLATVSFFVLFHIIEVFGKAYVNHPPPPEFMLRTEYPFQFPAFTVREAFSYPSGHSGRTTFLSLIALFLIWRSNRLAHVLKWVLTVIIIIFDGIMFVSRIYLGEHWLSDVIGGILLAGALGLCSLAFAPSKKHKNSVRSV